MRLHRPYIPLDVRERVIERQVRERHGFVPVTPSTKSKAVRIKALLHVLDPAVERWELHHRPALCNRVFRSYSGAVKKAAHYIPDANDPEFLHYVPEADHDIETRVRGLHGQHSDLALLRKNKRILRKRERAIGKVTSSTLGKRGWTLKADLHPNVTRIAKLLLKPDPKRKYKWPTRKLQSRPFSRSR